MSKMRPSKKELFEGTHPATVRADEIPNVALGKLGLEQNDSISEEEKMKLVRSRFLDIKEDDLMEGDEFFYELDSGMYEA